MHLSVYFYLSNHKLYFLATLLCGESIKIKHTLLESFEMQLKISYHAFNMLSCINIFYNKLQSIFMSYLSD